MHPRMIQKKILMEIMRSKPKKNMEKNMPQARLVKQNVDFLTQS
jgi:hypothetical protein